MDKRQIKPSDLMRAMTDGRLNLLETDLDRRVIGDSLERQSHYGRGVPGKHTVMGLSVITAGCRDAPTIGII